MNPATWPREERLSERVLRIDPTRNALSESALRTLPELLEPGDLVVVNDAATIPASLAAADGTYEVRLAGEREDGSWDVIVFGRGDWRTKTENRPQPPGFAEGAVLELVGGLTAKVVAVDPTERQLRLRFAAPPERFWSTVFRHGRPVQYAYLRDALPPWHVQSAFAGRPWAAETPSAGRTLTWSLLLALRSRGVEWAWVSEGCGLSSTGSETLDRALPLPERFEVPPSTVDAVRRAKARGGRVIAIGTSVVRALEGCAEVNGGALRPARATTSLRLSRAHPLAVVDGLLTGTHEPGVSHHELLEAFAPPSLLESAHRQAEQRGFLAHEYGDLYLILPSRSG